MTRPTNGTTRDLYDLAQALAPNNGHARRERIDALEADAMVEPEVAIATRALQQQTGPPNLGAVEALVPGLSARIAAIDLDAAPPDSPAPRDEARPTICASSGDLAEVTSDAWTALRAANDPPRLFMYQGRAVRLELYGSSPVLKDLDLYRLRHEVDRAAFWYKPSKEGRVPAPPPVFVIHDMLAAPDLPLPRLEHIATAPVFTADGRLLATPGFDEASGILYHPPPELAVPDVPQTPTPEDVAHAKELIDELLCDFRFKPTATGRKTPDGEDELDDGAADRAAAVGLLLLPFVRDLIEGPTPLHCIEAPTPGAGKGLLTSCLLMPAFGSAVGTMPQCGDDAEWTKAITSSLLAAEGAVVIDNVRGALKGGELARALTSVVWKARILGKNELAVAHVRCVWVATGNNLSLDTEIARRCVRSRIDPQVARPWSRDLEAFRHPHLLEWARAHRGDLVWAALVLVQSWLAAGQPDAEGATLGSFEDWARVMGGILAHAGYPRFLGNLAIMWDKADQVTAAWSGFYQLWIEHYGDKAVGVSDLFSLLDQCPELPIYGSTDAGRKRSLGKALARQIDVIINGLRIIDAGRYQGARQYQLQAVDPQGARESREFRECSSQRSNAEEAENVYGGDVGHSPNSPNSPPGQNGGARVASNDQVNGLAIDDLALQAGYGSEDPPPF